MNVVKLEIEIIAAERRFRLAREAHDLACERAFIKLTPKSAATRMATLKLLGDAELALDALLEKMENAHNAEG